MKSDLFKVYVYGRPEGSENTPCVKVCRCDELGKIVEDVGIFEVWEGDKIANAIVTNSKQALNYFASKL